MTSDPSGYLSAIKSGTVVFSFIVVVFFFSNTIMFVFAMVLPAFRGVNAHRRQMVAKGQISKAPCKSEDDTPKSSIDALQPLAPQDSA